MNCTKLIIGGVIGLGMMLGTSAYATTGDGPESLKNVGKVEAPPKLIRKKTVVVTAPPKLIRNTNSLKKFGLHQFEDAGIVVVKPRKRDHIFDTTGTNVKAVTAQYGAKYTINGAYFRRDSSGVYNPAGALGSGELTSFDSERCKDVNLCSRFDLNTLKIDKEISTQVVAGNMRSAGPWMIREGQINADLTNKRSHWLKKTQRTVVVTSGANPYFVFTTTGYTLPDLALQIQALFPAGNALNLDGGSSTSFYSSQFGYNSKKTLPEFFVMW